jgi:chaperone required for assembly of F1-ATPase
MAGASATKKPTRFYKDVYVEKMEHGGGTFSLKLDNHYLKSPAGKILSIDSEPLARLIANEWESQDKEIRGELMHLTSKDSTKLCIIY